MAVVPGLPKVPAGWGAGAGRLLPTSRGISAYLQRTWPCPQPGGVNTFNQLREREGNKNDHVRLLISGYLGGVIDEFYYNSKPNATTMLKR